MLHSTAVDRDPIIFIVVCVNFSMTIHRRNVRKGRSHFKYLSPFQSMWLLHVVSRGHAAFGSALKISDSNRVHASYFMTYHTVLKSSADYISAMSSARAMAVNISEMLNVNNTDPKNAIQVFPYRWDNLELLYPMASSFSSIFYVFYEQYSSIVSDAILQLILSLAAIFVVTTVLLGLDPWSGATVVLVIACILLNLIGLMYWWSIDFNAISLVNLVMVGVVLVSTLWRFSIRLSAFRSNSARILFGHLRWVFSDCVSIAHAKH